MAVTFGFNRRTCFEWQIENPRSEGSSTSPVFHLDGSRWCFELETKFDDLVASRLIYLRLMRADKTFHNFKVKSYVEGQSGVHECVNQRTVSFSKPASEQISCLSSTRELPEDLMVDDILTLIFVIVVITEESDFEKIVETADASFQTPLYMDSRPCLDSLSEDFSAMHEQNAQSDLGLLCDGTTFLVHKNVLSARSEVLASMIQDNTGNPIEISDIDLPITIMFLEYLYSGTLTQMVVDIALPLYEAADKYKVWPLKRRCAEFLRENITVANALNLLVLANAHADEDLKEYIISFILDNEMPNESEGWDEFCDRHSKLANEVLNRAYRLSRNCK